MDKGFISPVIQQQGYPINIQKVTHAEPTQSFQEIFKDALNQVNQLQQESQSMTQKLITGEVEDVHQVMIAAQKASLTLDLTVQVRNKVIEAYQEVMRMQI